MTEDGKRARFVFFFLFPCMMTLMSESHWISMILGNRDICPVKKGYGMSVCALRPMEGATLYSILDNLHKTVLPTLEMTRSRQTEWQVLFFFFCRTR
jgi:hypothetical protein